LTHCRFGLVFGDEFPGGIIIMKWSFQVE
jgi:hypothetical protein